MKLIRGSRSQDPALAHPKSRSERRRAFLLSPAHVPKSEVYVKAEIAPEPAGFLVEFTAVTEGHRRLTGAVNLSPKPLSSGIHF